MSNRDLGRTVHKTRSQPTVMGTVPASISRNASGTAIGTFGGGTITLASGQEDIVYTTRPKLHRNLSNSCRHTRISYRYGDPGLNYLRVNNLNPSFPGYWTQYYQGHISSYLAHSVAIPAALAALGGSSIEQHLGVSGQVYVNDAWSKTKPDLTMVDMPNFLLELGQLKSLSSWWRGKSIGKTIKSRDLKHTAKQLSGGVLQYSFGVVPNIGDISAIISAVKTLKQRLADFRAMAGKTQHRQVVVAKESTSATGTFNYGGDSHSPCMWNASRSQRVTAHFVFTPKNMGFLDTSYEFLLGMLDTLGFELNPRIIWEAVPFSFVIDWFFNVSSFLESLKVDALEFPVELTDSYLQLKEDLSIGSYLRLDVNSTVSSATSWPGVATIQRQFMRAPLLPDYATMRALDVRWPSLKQAMLGFCLAVQHNGTLTRATNSSFGSSTSVGSLAFTPFTNVSGVLR
jgi:hypothetical protein